MNWLRGIYHWAFCKGDRWCRIWIAHRPHWECLGCGYRTRRT